MKKLIVPIFRQPPHSVICGLVCAQMIYAYYGVAKSIEELQKELFVTQMGTYAPQIGINLLNNGFNVEIVTQNPRLVGRLDRDLTQKELLIKFQSKGEKLTNDDKLVMNYFVDFMKQGGKVKVAVPSLTDLRDEIESGRPIISSLTNAALYNKNISEVENRPFSYTFHFCVVVDANNKEVTVNDPSATQEGGEKTYALEDFLFAVHSSSLGDLDNGCFIKIKKS